jgi:hypothetical protein
LKSTPYQLFFGKKPDVSMLRVVGSQAFVHVPKEKRGKVDKRSLRGIFVGYEPHCKGWSVLYRNGTAWRSEVSRDVISDEDTLGDVGSNACDSEDYLLVPLHDEGDEEL